MTVSSRLLEKPPWYSQCHIRHYKRDLSLQAAPSMCVNGFVKASVSIRSFYKVFVTARAHSSVA